LNKIQHLTERLGGMFELYETGDRRLVFRKLVSQMNEKKATQVIIGQSARSRWEEIIKGSVTQRLLREVRHMDVLVVADQQKQ
jgi:two-component system, OmpR family, sensor histidine kinase KdpD